ncbi:MAG: hypothetical protein R2880_10545 [Deinococcales bacterium]
MPKSMPKYLAVILVFILLTLLGYPLALLFGLPLAKRDREDVRKWEKVVSSSHPPNLPSSTATLP